MTTVPASTSGAGSLHTHESAGNLRRRAVHGSAWTLAGQGAGQLVRLASNVVLAHLLFPSAFAIMRVVNIVLQGLAMFSDIGIGPSIIQHRRGSDPVFLNTAWTIQVIRGCLLWLFACAVAWPVAVFYKNPVYMQVIPAAGLTALIAGFNPTAFFTLNRRLDLARLTLFDVGVQIFGAYVMVIWAYLDRSVWPLVGGAIATGLLRVIVGRRLTEHRDRFAWDRDVRRELMHFGTAVFLSTALLFLANQSESLVLGRMIDLNTFGIYAIASSLAAMGTLVLQNIMSKVIFPTFAILIRERPEQAVVRYRQVVTLTSLVGLALALGLALLGPWAIRVMYDKRYWDAGWMVQALAVQAGCDLIRAPAAWLLLAAGRPRYSVWASGARVAILLTVLPAALYFGDVHAGVWVVSLSAVPPMLVCSWGVAQTFPAARAAERLVSAAVIVIAAAFVWWFR